jgi:hypothetical protein
MSRIPATPELLKMAAKLMAMRRKRPQGGGGVYIEPGQAGTGRGPIARREAALSRQQLNKEYIAAQRALESQQAAKKQESEIEHARELEKIAFRERVKQKGTAGAGMFGFFQPPARRPVGPRPSGVVSGPEGVYGVGPTGQVEVMQPELIDPQTGELDMTRDPSHPSYQPPRYGVTSVRMPQPTHPLVDYLDSRQHEIPANEYEGLRRIVTSGQEITANQFINQVEDAAKLAKPIGRSVKDIELNIARLQMAQAKLSITNDPDGTIGRKIAGLIHAESRKLLEAREGTNPIRGTSFTSNDTPMPGGRPLTEDIARRFWEEAGRDSALARQLAIDAGYNPNA